MLEILLREKVWRKFLLKAMKNAKKGKDRTIKYQSERSAIMRFKISRVIILVSAKLHTVKRPAIFDSGSIKKKSDLEGIKEEKELRESKYIAVGRICVSVGT